VGGSGLAIDSPQGTLIVTSETPGLNAQEIGHIIRAFILS
jgi:hypothetical protein